MDAVAVDLLDHFPEDRHGIAITEREDRIEVHGRAALRHEAANHARRGLLLEQALRYLKDRLPGGPLAHPDQHDALPDRHDIAAFHRCAGKILVRIAPPDLEVAVLK